MDISSYIKAALSKKFSKEAIYLDLLKKGAKVDQITEAFKKCQHDGRDVQKQTTNTILVIAAILIGVGIFSFIASNWQEMTKVAKIIVIFIAMIAAHVSGFYLKEQSGYEKTGKALILLGTLIYGAGIFLIAQMFHTRAEYPEGFLLWMLGTLAIAFSLGEFSVLFYLAAILGIIGNGTEIFEIFNRFAENHYLYTSLPLLILSACACYFTSRHLQKFPEISKKLKDFFILLAMLFLGSILTLLNQYFGTPFETTSIIFTVAVLSLAAAYYHKSSLILIFGIIGILSWWEAKFFDWAEIKDITEVALISNNLFIGLNFLLLAPIHKHKETLSNFAKIYTVLGLAFVTFILLILSTEFGIEKFIIETGDTNIIYSWQITVGLIALIMGIINFSIYLLKTGLAAKKEILITSILTAFFAALSFSPLGALQFPGFKMFWAAIFNFLFFGEIIAIIFFGYYRKTNAYINLGVLLMAIFILMKYFDWFFTFLNKSLFFIVAGILLFVIGFFMEKTRKYLISNIEHEHKA